ncbi:MAG: adenylate kinase [Myxococcota bacterium]
MTARRLLLLGPPGAGKGTQAQRLEEQLRVPQISTGEMLRAAVAAGSPVGKRARSFMDRGELVPDEVVIGVAEERLRKADAARGFVLDGFPRTASQARALDTLLEALETPLECVVSIQVDEDALVERLLKRAELEERGDDTPETIRTRMRVYRERTQPLIDYYRGRGILAEVDGSACVEEVAKRVGEALAA